MDTDDLEPRRPTLETPNLEAMSIEALQDYIARLMAEIGRATTVIEAKKAARASADAVFKL